MSAFSITVQEGIASDDNAIYFLTQPPTYEAVQVPVAGGAEDQTTRIVFAVFTPSNGNAFHRNKVMKVPFDRVVNVTEGL